MRNFRLDPWIHVSSVVTNFRRVDAGGHIDVHARVADCFERKGREFVVLDVTLLDHQRRVVQVVRHTAIYKLGVDPRS